jgi:DNA polymerase-3 subunit delta
VLLKADALPAHLARGKLAPLYTVSGDEPLLAIEAADAIRAAARRAGFTERDVVHADARYDWSQLTGTAQGLSLFAERRLLEVRLRTGKPGKDGAAVLAAHAGRPAEDLLTIVTLPRLDAATRRSAWAEALERHGVWIDVPRVDRDALPAWIARRMAHNEHNTGGEALQFIADRVEGNLLAAHQEIQKLALLYPPGALTLQQISDSVLNVARFEVFGLPLAMLAGDPARVLRMVESLKAEGEPLPLALWAVSEELRTLLRVKAALDRGAAPAQATREAWVRRDKEAAVQRAAQRLQAPKLAALLARCAEVDRLFKGLRAPRADSDAWLELADIALAVARG